MMSYEYILARIVVFSRAWATYKNSPFDSLEYKIYSHLLSTSVYFYVHADGTILVCNHVKLVRDVSVM